MVTSNDVARLAGVSQTTVSRVFRQTGKTSAEAKERVISAARTLRYQPSEAARALVLGRNRQVALVVESLTQPAFSLISDIAHRCLLDIGYRLVIVESDVAGDLKEVSIQQFAGVDGVIFAAAEREARLQKTISAIGQPVVLAVRKSASNFIDGVYPDHAGGAELAVDHLWSLGHRNILMIGANKRFTHGYETAEGFRSAMHRRGIHNPSIVSTDWGYDEGWDHALRFLSHEQRPTAVFAADDSGAYGVIDAARHLGMRIPEDLSVVGFDDFDTSAWKAYDLTTIKIDYDQIVSQAVKILKTRIREHAEDTESISAVDEIVPVSLTLRASTGRIDENHHNISPGSVDPD